MVNISVNNKAINLIFSEFIAFGNPYKTKKDEFSSSFENQVMYKNLIEITLTIWQQGYKWLSSFPLQGAGKSNGGF